MKQRMFVVIYISEYDPGVVSSAFTKFSDAFELYKNLEGNKSVRFVDMCEREVTL